MGKVIKNVILLVVFAVCVGLVCRSIYEDIKKEQISILRIPALSFMFSRSGKKGLWQRGGIGTSWYQILSVGESFRSVL